MNEKQITKRCTTTLNKQYGLNLTPQTSFQTIFPNNWFGRQTAVAGTVKSFGMEIPYGDVSPYFANNATELAQIIHEYIKPYTKIKTKITQIFKTEFNIPHIKQNANIYATHNPNITAFGLLNFMTKIEDTFNITIPNPGKTTQNLDTLEKWGTYVAQIKGIQVPQKHK